MRKLDISAIVLAASVATLSIIFIGLAYNDGWSGGSPTLISLLGDVDPIEAIVIVVVMLFLTFTFVWSKRRVCTNGDLSASEAKSDLRQRPSVSYAGPVPG